MNTEKRDIHISEISQATKQVVQQISALAAEKKINPKNTIVMIGERHDQIQHHYFEKKLLQHLHEADLAKQLVVEGSVGLQSQIDHAADRHPYLKTAHAVFNKKSIHGRVYGAPLHYAFKHEIPVKYVDAETLSFDTCYFVNNAVSDNFLLKHRGNKAVKDLLHKNPDVVQQKYGLDAPASRRGLIKRNIYMLDNIVDICTPRAGLSLMVAGQQHLVDRHQSNDPTLSEMVYASGKDIVNIRLHTAKDFDQKYYDFHGYTAEYQQAVEMQNQRLEGFSGKGSFTALDVEISGNILQNWSGMCHLHKINHDEVMTGMRVITAAKALVS